MWIEGLPQAVKDVLDPINEIYSAMPDSDYTAAIVVADAVSGLKQLSVENGLPPDSTAVALNKVEGEFGETVYELKILCFIEFYMTFTDLDDAASDLLDA